jgi:acetoin utilization protein AcuB
METSAIRASAATAEVAPLETHVRVHMTAGPHSVGAHEPMAAAHRLMRQHRIRHLPVLRGGKLVGVVTQRDLYLVETLRDVDPMVTTVEAAMTADVYAVPPNEPLERVAKTMADRKYGCAIVLEGDQVVGIFTTVDALRALANLLAARRAGEPARAD